MLKPSPDRWNQTLDDLWALSVRASHSRTRERFSALWRILAEQRSATSVAASISRNDRTVMSWVRVYNHGGPDALLYARTGGRRPLFHRSKPKS